MRVRVGRFVFLPALAAGVFASARAAAPPLKGPYLQYAQPPSRRAITIAWETKDPSVGFVEYVTRGQSRRRATDKKRDRRHEVTISGLKPGAVYVYGLGGDVSGGGTFAVPVPGRKKIRFVAFGDPRAYDKATLNLIGEIVKDRPEFIIAQGDYIHKPGDPRYANWVECFRSFAPLFKDVPFFPAVGDHDVGGGGKDYSEYTAHFCLPGNELHYSFDWGRCHFLSLNVTWGESLRPGTEQYGWIENDLRAAAGRYDFIFAYYHLPMDTVGHYGRDPDAWSRARKRLLPLFKKYRVRASFGAHDHNYQHWELEGHTFVLSGGLSRQRLYDIKAREKVKAETAAGRLRKALKVPHYILVEVDGKRATFTVKGESGTVVDRFQLMAYR